jgi:large subunit ribosomal protein L19
MKLNLVSEVTKSQIRNDLPDFRSGCTVRVDVIIKEGDKTRIQALKALSLPVAAAA